MTLPSADTIISIAALVGALIALWKYNTKAVHFFDELADLQKRVTRAEENIKNLEESRKKAIEEIKEYHDGDNGRIREEQQILIYCSLACLKGLQQLGANGDVTEAISRIEKHLNMAAHQ